MGLRKKLTWLGSLFVDGLGIHHVRAALPYAEAPDEITVPIPGYRQANRYSCGYAASLMVAHMFDPGIDSDAFYDEVSPCPQHGTTTRQIRSALWEYGVDARPRHELRFRDYVGAIEAGCPVIACVTTKDPTIHHWVVVYGVGLYPPRLFVAGQGVFRNDHLTWESFLNRRTDQGFALVCSPR